MCFLWKSKLKKYNSSTVTEERRLEKSKKSKTDFIREDLDIKKSYDS